MKKRVFKIITKDVLLRETAIKPELIDMYDKNTKMALWKETIHNQYYIQCYDKDTGEELIVFRYKKNLFGKWFISYREGRKEHWYPWEKITD